MNIGEEPFVANAHARLAVLRARTQKFEKHQVSLCFSR